MAITDDDVVCFFGTPGAGGVNVEVARRQRLPHVKDGIDHGPTGLHHVRALEQGLIAGHAVVEKNFVPGIGGGPEVIKVVEIHFHRTDSDLRARNLGAKAQRDSFIRSNVDDKLVGFQAAYGRVAKENEGGALELNGDLSVAHGQSLAGAKVKGNSRP